MSVLTQPNKIFHAHCKIRKSKPFLLIYALAIIFLCWQSYKNILYIYYIVLQKEQSLSSLPFLCLMYACDWVRWLNTTW